MNEIANVIERCRAAGLVPLFEGEARARQSAAGGAHPGPLPATLQEAKGESRAKAAEAVNVSPRTVANAVAVTWKAKQERAKAETSKAKADGGRKAGRGRPIASGSREPPPKPDYRKKEAGREAARFAAEAGVSTATMRRALELEEKRPEAAAAVARGEVEGHKALAEVKRAVRVERLIEVPA